MLSQSRCLTPSLTAGVLSPKSPWWRERRDSRKLASDFHTHAHAHKKINKNVINIFFKEQNYSWSKGGKAHELKRIKAAAHGQ